MSGWRHSSGDTDGGCDACAESEAFFEPEERTPAHEAEPCDDGDEDPWCWCGHDIERKP